MAEVETAKRAGAWFAAVATRTNTATHQEMKVEKRKEIILRKKDKRKEMYQPTIIITTTTEELKWNEAQPEERMKKIMKI